MAKGNGTFRIGTGAGFSADRLDPAVDLARRGRLHVMVLECLGERTVAFAHRDRMADPRRGYNALLERRMRALLPVCMKAGTVIITNMGAANPRAATERTRDIARELGIAGVKIACIEGDDVSGLVPRSQPFMDEEGVLADIGRPIVGMNAYLGADAIIPALEAGANVVIGGRLADPSMYLAPMMRHYGWQNSDLAKLGAGTLVGHLMECGMQITGGYFADPGLKDVPDLAHCGYPIAEVAADGSAVITKLPGSGGRVNEATVKEQLLYEVHDPAAYLTPDITADFSQVKLNDLGNDRVAVSDADGRTRPERLKVTIGFDAGVLAEAGVSYAGPSAGARGLLAAQIVEARLKEAHGIKSPVRIDLIGANSLFATAGKEGADSEDVRLHVALRTADRGEAELMLWEVESLLCCGPAGGGGFRGSITPAVETKSVLVERGLVKPTCEIFVT
ncbi:MAG TPA: acyclic terpene utilization AtuA family protein [Pseudolabrys sp.]|jgi:hypothetical protein|nr:acyclic terpene utilization AtuA family protein [Pseudolabrys sp.]